jgi:pimeloyl-ACP methyl ester carboxylesterase
VHGFPLDHRMWRGQIDGLAGAARVVAPDLPGFGETPPASDGLTPTTMDAYADTVLALADALGFARFVLAGLSMGGYAALSLARRRPERLAGLILVDTRAEADAEAKQQERIADADDVLAHGYTRQLAEVAKNALSPETQARRRDLVELVQTLVAQTPRAGYAAAQRGMAARRDARDDLARLTMPTLCLGGADDVITPPDGMRRLAAAIPGAEMEVVAQAGHLAPLEQPEVVNAAILRLLRRVAP